jgi:two-component system sensor histidine kinase DesK
VRDNGCGGVVAPGNGLTGMRERVRECGGTLSVDSPRGQGTSIEASLPFSLRPVRDVELNAPARRREGAAPPLAGHARSGA